ncbi:hypothetical protein FDP41_004546 [Naegleria fowleri]|uniref:CDC20/Fizzy WD40 domain-containing protein n=1 Tax=Naegleria fowleri TaxID=5763 RepID=A0A6A5BN48_NAEFO|nr:uncharacterized protein FDP41_004593 [Naegleria fowleri]XP_044561360.1 uncharacterized protein FDP41_004546 [Naegleria fowleri]KAF0976366.1 hypothetical protein FDP41_004593 [Naegleria fowleri]KAF0976647.1 hypothetical protein FDP41_004546 [Naegleria fowleri]CAG4716620.1 unnamed protein product [Naegleria fowleri]
MSGFNFEDHTDINNEDLNTDLSSVYEPRWKRKQKQRPQSTTTVDQVMTDVIITMNNISCSSGPTTTTSTTSLDQRFIPSRRTSQDMDICKFNLMNCMEDDDGGDCGGGSFDSSSSSDKENTHNRILEQRLFDGKKVKDAKILALTEKAPKAPSDWHNNLRVLYSQNKIFPGNGGACQNNARKQVVSRHIPQTPEKVLDAPQMIDDYYLNLLDWNSNNVLAVALCESVYLWNGETGDINKLMSCSQQDNYITSVSWVEDGTYLAIGTNYNDVQIWDVNRSKQIRTMKGHTQRVCSLAWNTFILSSGGKDGKILNHDVRQAKHLITTQSIHQDFEVCGLKWSHDGNQLASGANDNILNIWDKSLLLTQSEIMPKFSLREHVAAVKALAWCPWQANLLASGGGTSDRKMMFWNTQTGTLLNTIDTNSQVCSLIWSKSDREIISSHGFSQNQLCVWKYPSLVKVAELTGHKSRVLHMAQSPDGTTIVSAAGDETLRFWKVFSPIMHADKLTPSEHQSVLATAPRNMRSIR